MDLFDLKCPICGRYFENKNCLSTHIKSTHEGKTYQCKYCEHKCRSKYDLKAHIESIHEGITFLCQHCEQKFTRKVERDVSTNTQSSSMKVKHFNVNIAGIKQQQKVISRLTYCPNKGGVLFMRGKRFLYF